LHGSISYRVPWLFDDEASDVLRFFTKQKNALMPYIFAQAMHTHQTGIPMMRPMVLAHPHDPVCCNLDMQYMFGENILVAPIFNDEGNTNTYLPDENGAWTNLLTNEKRAGGRYIAEKHDYFSLGLWVKPNSIIAMGCEKQVVYNYAENPTLHVYELTDHAEAKLYSGITGDHTAKLAVGLDRKGSQIVMNANPAHGGFTFILHNVKATAEGAACEAVAEGTKITVPANCTEMVFTV
jgi:alpha-D-xyloside xylohydrolase